MTWVIERRPRRDPIAYWGHGDRWFARRPAPSYAQQLHPVPEQACRFHSWNAVFEVAEWLRLNEKLEYGEVIAIVTMPEVGA